MLGDLYLSEDSELKFGGCRASEFPAWLAGCELGKGDWSEESWLERFSKLTEALMKRHTSMLNQSLSKEIQKQLKHLLAVDTDGVELDALEQMWQKASTAVGHLDAVIAGLKQSSSASTSVCEV